MTQVDKFHTSTCFPKKFYEVKTSDLQLSFNIFRVTLNLTYSKNKPHKAA